jgi:hypothetical protein
MSESKPESSAPVAQNTSDRPADDAPVSDSTKPVEIGGREGPDPARFGDWEKNGRCIDF